MMKRRLFFLLPDARHAEQVGTDLTSAAVTQQDIHIVAPEGVEIKGIDDVHRADERDNDSRIEWWAWRINLAVFFIAAIAFVLMLFISPSYWLILPALIMIVTFSLGLAAVLRLPSAHLDEFRPAVRHGEILLMVDTPPARILDISHYIRRRHPEALIGGVGWHVG